MCIRDRYGTYIPFSMAICHTINHKSGVDHTTYAHTGALSGHIQPHHTVTELFHQLGYTTALAAQRCV